MKDTLARVLRTFLQLVAGGGLTAVFDQFAKDVPTRWTPYVVLGAALLVSLAQNLLEEFNVIPTVLKPASPPAPATVEPVQ